MKKDIPVGPKCLNFNDGTLEATRTPDLRLRRQLLYPTELRGQILAQCLYIINK